MHHCGWISVPYFFIRVLKGALAGLFFKVFLIWARAFCIIIMQTLDYVESTIYACIGVTYSYRGENGSRRSHFEDSWPMKDFGIFQQ